MAGSILVSGRNKVLDALYSHKGKVGWMPASVDALEVETGLSRRALLAELGRLRRRGLVEELTP